MRTRASDVLPMADPTLRTNKPENGTDPALKKLALLGDAAGQVPLQSLLLEVIEQQKTIIQLLEESRRWPPHDDQVMTFREWCELNGISQTTGLEIIRAGEGPEFIWLSANRKGLTYRQNRKWQESRKKAD
jgi:hypothetical protein